MSTDTVHDRAKALLQVFGLVKNDGSNDPFPDDLAKIECAFHFERASAFHEASDVASNWNDDTVPMRLRGLARAEEAEGLIK